MPKRLAHGNRYGKNYPKHQNTLKTLIKIESIAYHISDSKKSWDLVTSQDENSTWAVQSRVTLENMIT